MDEEELIAKSNEAWETLSEWWDDDINDGDPFHRHLIFPNILKLIDFSTKPNVLDIACGNGTLTRRMSALGANALGVDVSEVFINQAKKRSNNNIRWQVLDATSEQALNEISENENFDIVVCSMALHDLPTISPLLSSLKALMKNEGQFIFSIPHPCFNMGEVLLDFNPDTPSVCRSSYIEPMHLEMKSKPNQPINQHCFHRSLTDIFNQCFSAGLVLTNFEEPTLLDTTDDLTHVDLDWKYLPHIPPALICGWRFR